MVDDQNKQENGQRATAGHVGIHTSGFKDFQLKAELLRAITDCGFEHPSEGTVDHLAQKALLPILF